MRYHVAFGPDWTSECAVDLVELPNGNLQARVDGRPIELDLLSIAKSVSVRVGAQMMDLTMYGLPPDVEVVVRGYRGRLRVENARARSAARLRAATGGHGEKVVKSPMPGRVVKVLVGVGEAVRAGQGLVVLEAMKMENEVVARAAGTVAKVHVTAGTAVERSAPLVTLT
jgi:biotin carboxyl carrier protein